MTDAQAYSHMVHNHRATLQATLNLLQAGETAPDVLSAIMLYGDGSNESRDILTWTRQSMRHALTLTGYGDRLEAFGL